MIESELNVYIAHVSPPIVSTQSRWSSRHCRRSVNYRVSSVCQKSSAAKSGAADDWMNDMDKVLMGLSGRDHLAAALNGVFDSQIAGGDRYDLATQGRCAANATFFESHATDKSNQLILRMNLMPVVANETKNIVEFVTAHIEKFAAEVKTKLNQGLI